MKKCFLCGKEYDDVHRQTVLNLYDFANKCKPEPVNRISDQHGVLRLCYDCIRAGAFVYARLNASFHILCDIEPEYEETANQTTP